MYDAWAAYAAKAAAEAAAAGGWMDDAWGAHAALPAGAGASASKSSTSPPQCSPDPARRDSLLPSLIGFRINMHRGMSGAGELLGCVGRLEVAAVEHTAVALAALDGAADGQAEWR